MKTGSSDVDVGQSFSGVVSAVAASGVLVDTKPGLRRVGCGTLPVVATSSSPSDAICACGAAVGRAVGEAEGAVVGRAVGSDDTGAAVGDVVRAVVGTAVVLLVCAPVCTTHGLRACPDDESRTFTL